LDGGKIIMAWDIYGNNLRRGYCEVHPDVPQEYPCMYCMQDIDRENRYQDEQGLIDAYHKEQMELVEREYRENAEIEIVTDHLLTFKRFLITT
jgi:hypothetical protein